MQIGRIFKHNKASFILSRTRIFRHRKDRGGDGFHLTPARPPTNPENQQIEYLYAHTLPLNQLTKYSVLRVVGLKETSKFDLFTKFLNQILHFWIFSKKKSELNSTHHFSPFFPKWSQQSKKKRQNDIQNFFVLGVPKVL